MVVWQFWLNIYIILLLKLHICFADSKTLATSGPYKSILLKVEMCKKVSRPYIIKPPIVATAGVYKVSNKTYVSLNLSIEKDTSNVKIRLTNYVMENGKWIPIYFISDFGCRSVILVTSLAALGIKYDSDKCMFLKGRYYFDNLDINTQQHVWIKKMEYGLTKWKSEISHRLGTLNCFEYYIKNVPLEN